MPSDDSRENTQMKRSTKWAALVSIAALVLAACGADEPGDEPEATPDEVDVEEEDEGEDEAPEEDEGDEGEEEEAAPVRADADLVIWADDTRRPVIEPFAERFGEEQGITVAVQEVAFDQIRDNVSIQGPAGQGPDVFIGAHDWLGELVENGVVAPLDLAGASDDYLEVALQAFAYEGTNYGLPYSIENIALIRNTELAPERPETLEDMWEVGLGLVESGDAELPVGWQQNDPFHNYWVVTGAGGYVFGQEDDGSYNADDLGLDTEGGLRAAELFGEMYDVGFVNPDVDYDVMINSFANGETPFAVTGPWALGDFGGVDFVVEPFPTIDGNAPGPFVGVQGFFVSSFAENELAARTFVLDFMGTDDAQLELYEAGNRPPALISAFEQVQDDPIVAGFGAAGETGAPMPAIPAMGSVWEAWTNAYTNINSGNDPEAAFQEAADQIRNLIG
ncbi:MAG: maltose ABC transporter substrate-binding protein [Nitriliruptoraceae bacterium]|nr:maltose ABC transporter substrate-binding protein [Nitriliruptoraceae bacterium]